MTDRHLKPDKRRARIARLAAKRPREPRVIVTYAPDPDRVDRLVDLLYELLDERFRSGRR